MPQSTINGRELTEVTINGNIVQEITMNNSVVYRLDDERFLFSINGGEPEIFTPVRTAESHDDYMRGWRYSDIKIEWGEPYRLGMAIHQDTRNEDDFMLCIVYHDADFSAPSWNFDIKFDEQLSEPPIQDDRGEFPAGNELRFDGGGTNTDGVGIPIDNFTDVDITIDFYDGRSDEYVIIEGPDQDNVTINSLSTNDTITLINEYPLGTLVNPASSGYELAQERPELDSGYYYIKSDSIKSQTTNPIRMYVDMETEGGGYDFYPIQNGNSVNQVTDNNSGKELGLDLVYPRSKEHWIAMTDFVADVLGESGSNFDRYFETAYAVHRDSQSVSGGDYTNYIMRDPDYYESGAPDWKVPDGGRWWLRDTTFDEPNGDYGYHTLLGINAQGRYTIEEDYDGRDLRFNDLDNGYTTGGYYLVSTNQKP